VTVTLLNDVIRPYRYEASRSLKEAGRTSEAAPLG